MAIFTHTDVYSCQRSFTHKVELSTMMGHCRHSAVPPAVIQLLIECIHDFLFISAALRRHFCWEMFVLSSNTFFSSLVYVEGKFFSFSFTTWQEKNVRCWFFFPHFPSSFLKIVLILLLLPRQQSRNMERCVFFLRQLTPTVSTVFSHRKVACYLHKQEF